MNFKQVLSISRPRFWLYEFGTFILGLLIGFFFIHEVSVGWEVFLFGFYFLIPANILIYGINDIFDYETDIKNPKKVEYEDVLMPEQHRSVYRWIILTNVPFALLALFTNIPAFIAFVLFVFFATFYSAKPIRAKARPVLDSIFSASHYVVTGVFGYLLVTGAWVSVNWWLVIAPLLWAVAMHAYSAVPDIQADSDSDLDTIATMLGSTLTLMLCGVLYPFAFLIVSLVAQASWILLLALPYLALCFVSIKASDEKLFRYYKYFPYLNALCGAIVTLYVLLLIA